MPNIHHAAIIAAPAEKFYNAITRQEGLSAWWTPDTKTKPEVGSVACFTFGSGYFKEMKIAELKPFEQVTWLCLAGADEWIGTTISFKLQTGDKELMLSAHPEAGDQVAQKMNGGIATLLTLQHDNWAAYTPMFAECSYTWAQFLKSLALLCETGRGAPWPNQHRTPVPGVDILDAILSILP